MTMSLLTNLARAALDLRPESRGRIASHLVRDADGLRLKRLVGAPIDPANPIVADEASFLIVRADADPRELAELVARAAQDKLIGLAELLAHGDVDGPTDPLAHVELDEPNDRRDVARAVAHASVGLPLALGALDAAGARRWRKVLERLTLDAEDADEAAFYAAFVALVDDETEGAT